MLTSLAFPLQQCLSCSKKTQDKKSKKIQSRKTILSFVHYFLWIMDGIKQDDRCYVTWKPSRGDRTSSTYFPKLISLNFLALILVFSFTILAQLIVFSLQMFSVHCRNIVSIHIIPEAPLSDALQNLQRQTAKEHLTPTGMVISTL